MPAAALADGGPPRRLTPGRRCPRQADLPAEMAQLVDRCEQLIAKSEQLAEQSNPADAAEMRQLVEQLRAAMAGRSQADMESAAARARRPRVLSPGRMMAEGLLDRPADGEVRCPTCGAVQEWSDACRRCRCELTLLRRAADEALDCSAALLAGVARRAARPRPSAMPAACMPFLPTVRRTPAGGVPFAPGQLDGRGRHGRAWQRLASPREGLDDLFLGLVAGRRRPAIPGGSAFAGREARSRQTRRPGSRTAMGRAGSVPLPSTGRPAPSAEFWAAGRTRPPAAPGARPAWPRAASCLRSGPRRSARPPACRRPGRDSAPSSSATPTPPSVPPSGRAARRRATAASCRCLRRRSGRSRRTAGGCPPARRPAAVCESHPASARGGRPAAPCPPSPAAGFAGRRSAGRAEVERRARLDPQPRPDFRAFQGRRRWLRGGVF